MKIRVAKRPDWPEFDGPYNHSCHEKPWVVIWYPWGDGTITFSWRKFENWTAAVSFANNMAYGFFGLSAVN